MTYMENLDSTQHGVIALYNAVFQNMSVAEALAKECGREFISHVPVAKDKIKKIITLHERGMSSRQIAAKLDMPRTTVFYHIAKYKKGVQTNA